MKVKELNPDIEIAILDGFNGGGFPRAINLGPVLCDDCTDLNYSVVGIWLLLIDNGG